MKIGNILLIVIIVMLGVNQLNAGPKGINCTVTDISESVIQKLKKRISPF